MLPVVQRELTEASRKRALLALRLLGAATPAAVLWATMGGGGLRFGDGSVLFGRINALLLTLSWMVAPLLTADCLSRERREGTMGLLFLTPLRPSQVVLAKAAAVFLGSASVAAAAFPVLAVPVLLGGVGWMDLTRMVVAQAAALLVGLAAGLLASSWVTGWFRVRIAAAAVSACAGVGVGVMTAVLRSAYQWWIWRPLPRGYGFGDLWLANALKGLGRIGFGPSSGSLIWTNGSGAHTGWASLGLAVAGAVFAAALAGFTLWLAVRVLDHTWRPAAPSPRTERLAQVLTRQSLFPRWTARYGKALLSRAPALWLQNLSWQARVFSFLTFGATAIYLVPYATYRGADYEEFRIAAWVLLAITALAAASSFRVERETGALELVLTTTLSPSAIATARVASVTAYFLPSALLLALSAAFLGLHDQWSVRPVGPWAALDLAPWTVAVASLGVGLATAGRSPAICVLAPLAVRHALVWVSGAFGDGSAWPGSFQLLLLSTACAAVAAHVGWRLAREGLAGRSYLGAKRPRETG